MTFSTPLKEGTLLKRYKRFLADIRFDDGETITAHCANTGPMTGCATPGSRAALSYHGGGKRKLPWSLELTQVDGTWICVNTARPNAQVEAAIRAGTIEELQGYPELRREVRWGEKSRLDILLQSGEERCYVEVKNCTLRENEGAYFPDTITTRGQKHMRELADVRRAGQRAVVFFVVNRGDCQYFAPAHHIDPAYGQALLEAVEAGVEVLAYEAPVNPTCIAISRPLEVRLNP